MFSAWMTFPTILFFLGGLSTSAHSALLPLWTRDTSAFNINNCIILIEQIGIPQKLDSQGKAHYDVTFQPTCALAGLKTNFTRLTCSADLSAEDIGNVTLPCQTNGTETKKGDIPWTPNVTLEQNNSTTRLPYDGGVQFNLSAGIPEGNVMNAFFIPLFNNDKGPFDFFNYDGIWRAFTVILYANKTINPLDY